MDNHTPQEERDPMPGALVILLLIVLLFGKAIGMPIPWILVFAPLWGPFLWIVLGGMFFGK